MCGIAGVVAWDDRFRVSREILGRMSARIAHRGPDAQGEYLNHEGEAGADRPQAGLVHRRLAIIDVDARANQPFSDGQGRWIVLNGEIYNYRELRSELTKLLPDYTWRTSSDTEVLLAAYGAWGEKCVEKLNGMFALAVWDENEGALFLARDRMGQKPLYFAWGAGARAVAFASELGAIRAVPWVDAEVSEAQVAEYLRWGYLPSDTIYRNVHKLPAGHCQIMKGSEGGCWKYADANDARGFDGEHDAATAKELIGQAVRRQMVSDVPLGCFLSGGVDSSIVALCMKRAVGSEGRVLTFTIGFDDARYDETAYAAAVAKHVGTEHRQFVVRANAAEDLPKLAAVYGEPFGDSSALPTHYLARETRQYVKVALAGDGGDELFGGYDRYRAVRMAAMLGRLPKPVRAALAGCARAVPGAHPKSAGARLRRLLASLGWPAAERYASYVRLFDEEMVGQLLGSAQPAQWPAPVQTYAQLGDRRDLVERALATDRVTYLPEDLHTKVDRASMLHALEVRAPFMDVDLVQFAAGLRTDELLRGGAKRMLREAFAADLPEFVFRRPKMGFAVPVGEWFRGELKGMLRDHLFAVESFASQHFNRAMVQRLVDEHEAGRVDHSQRLYALLMLELWWRGSRGGGVMSAYRMVSASRP